MNILFKNIYIMNMKFKEFRTKINKTQEQVATLIGVSTQTYQNYELGKREADYDTLLKIANLFNASLDELFDRKDNNFINLNYVADEEKSIIENVRKLNKENLLKVEAYVFSKLEEQNK